jgi:hypothetical protein
MVGDVPMEVEVVVGLVTNPGRRVLLTFNERWGAFTLPMTRRRRGREGNEPLTRAAYRAAGEALGVPVRLVQDDPKRLAGRLQSARQMVDKQYRYDVFHVEPHPDFDDRLRIRQPHLWLSPHMVLAGAYEPISESARTILRGTLKDFGIPARVQHASVVIVHRDDPERGRQFLLRWDPDWGYALPAKRWDHAATGNAEDRAASALGAAERVVRRELGLEPDADIVLDPARSPELTTHGVSPTGEMPAFGAATDYHHSLFVARIRHPEKLRSERPLAWVTEEEIHHGWTAGSAGVPGAPSGFSARVSSTARDVLAHLGLIAEAEAFGPGVDRLAEEWLASRETRRS